MENLIFILQARLLEMGSDVHSDTQRVLLKEVLGAYVLDFIYNHNVYRTLNFYGGTCLHAVYGLNRLSEDIDLDNQAGIDLSDLPEQVKQFCAQNLGYPATYVSTQRSRQDILRIILRFPILGALGLSMHADENLHLKLEISHHGQIARIDHTPIIYFGRSFAPAHFSLPTMMAGKMLACIERNFVSGSADFKGRDFYDLLWLMEKGVKPLEEKLQKDGKISYDIYSAFATITQKINAISISALRSDLRPLFSSAQYIDAWLSSFKDRYAHLMGGYTS